MPESPCEEEAEERSESRPLMDMKTLERISPILRHAAHPLRLRILDFLGRDETPRHVTEIRAVCEGAEQAIVSQQLRILKDHNILTVRRDGTRMYYSIANRKILGLLECIVVNDDIA